MAGKKTLAAAVGLDIGSSLIKVVEAKAGKGGPSISGIGIAPTPEGAVDNNVIMDPVAVGQAVKALLSESGIKSKPVVSAVAGQSSVVVRVIEVPKMTREELAETMKFEVERHVPFSVNEVIMDFAPLEKPSQPPDAQNMEVLLAVAQQDVVSNHVEALFAAGLAPRAIEVEPLAAGRALLETGDGTSGGGNIVAVADIGATKTEVGIFENGTLAFACPPLQIAGSAFTRAISEYLQISTEEAEALKKQFAAVDPSKVAGVSTGTSQGWDPFSGYDAGAAPEPTVAGTGPVVDLDAEPVPDQPVSGFGSAFDFGGGTGEPKPQEDVYDLGGEDVPPVTKPVFDLEEEPEPQSAGEQTGPTKGPFEENVQAEGTGEPHAVLRPEPAEGAEDREAAAHPSVPVPVGADAETREKIAEAISPVLVDLATELRGSLGFYQTRYGALPDKVLLTGGTAKIAGLAKYLELELGIPVEVGDPFSNVPVSSARYSEQYLRDISPLFSVSVGLAMREMLPD